MPQELSHDDAVAALQKLSPDKQREVLGRLSPEGKKNLMAKITAGTTPTTPAPQGIGAQFDAARGQVDAAFAPQVEAGSGLVGRLKNAAKGALAPFEGMFLHPVETTRAGGENTVAFGGGPGMGVPAFGPTGNTQRDVTNMQTRDAAIASAEAQGKEDLKHPVYTAASIIGPPLLTHAVTRGIARVRGGGSSGGGGGGGDVEKTPIRDAVRETLKVGEEFQKKTAQDYAKDAADVRAKNQKAVEDTNRARGVVDEKNEVAQRRHVKKTVRQLKQDAAKLRRVAATRARIQAENQQAAVEHKGGVERTLQERDAAEQVAGMREQAETEATESAQALEKKTATTKATAKAKNDTLWNNLREKIGNDPIDATGKVEEQVADVKKGLTPEESAQLDAVLQSQMSPEERAEDVQLAAAYNELSPEFKGHVDKMTGTLDQLGGIDKNGAEPMTFGKLHGIYTELGLKLSRGGLAGNVYKGLVTLRESIGDMMQTVADQKGAGDDLRAARKSHQEFAEAFYKERPKPLSAADKQLKASNPEAYADKVEAERIAKVAKHDPSIAEDYKRVQAAREKARSLPKPEQLRKGLPQPPDRPTETSLPEMPTPRPTPEPPTPKSYGEPEPTTPDAHVPDLTQVTREQVRLNLKKYGSLGTWAARLLLGGGIAHTLFKGDFGAFTSQLAMGEIGLQIVSRYLQSADMLDMLARPTADTLRAIDSVPPQDAMRLREVLTGLIKHDAGGKPVVVDPKIAQFLGPKSMAIIGGAVAGANVPKTAGDAKKRVEDAKYMATPNPKGLVERGTLPIWTRPTVQNADGSHSTEYSTSREEDGKEILVPTIVNGKFLTPDGKKPEEGSDEEQAMFDRAWQHYKDTGEHLGKFDNADDATAYAHVLHNRGEKK